MKLFGTSNYIEIYDNSLSARECDMIISAFEEGGPTPGYTSDGYAPDDKKSMDIPYKFSQSNKVSNIIYPNLIRGLSKYYKKYDAVLKENSFFGIYNHFNVQKYETEEDGYKVWHCEHGPSPTGSMRILAWMFYLNNAKSGTEFKRYPTVQAKRGRCVIWPSAWTHVHRGVIPNKGLKYIATGWVSFKNVESSPTIVDIG